MQANRLGCKVRAMSASRRRAAGRDRSVPKSADARPITPIGTMTGCRWAPFPGMRKKHRALPLLVRSLPERSVTRRSRLCDPPFDSFRALTSCGAPENKLCAPGL